MKKIMILMAMVFMVMVSSVYAQSDVDFGGENFFERHDIGKDKFLHAGGCAVIAAGSHVAIKTIWPEMNDWKALGLASLFTMGVGVAKEVYDHQQPGNHFDIEDVYADAVGVGAYALYFSVKF